LAVTALLRPLVSEHRSDRKQLCHRQRLLEIVFDVGAHHARRRFRTQRHALAALVRKGVHLFLDNVCGLTCPLGEKLLLFENGRPQFDVSVALAPVACGALDELPLLHFAGQNVVSATDRRDHARPPNREVAASPACSLAAPFTDSPLSTARSSPRIAGSKA